MLRRTDNKKSGANDMQCNASIMLYKKTTFRVETAS